MPLLERKVNVVWSKFCYPFDDRWILFQKTLKRRKKRKCVSTTKDVVTQFILQLSRDFQSRIASCPDCQRVEVTDVVFKYRKKKRSWRECRRFQTHESFSKISSEKGKEIYQPHSSVSLVRSGLNVRLLKLPSQNDPCDLIIMSVEFTFKQIYCRSRFL